LNGDKLHIGTSGWSYQHWKGLFYPENVKEADWLTYYSSHFDSVEINSTFYRLPSEKTAQNWKHSVPKNFTFSVKASQYITHQKKLKDPVQSSRKFFESLKLLTDNLGPLLFQLPPRWHKNVERLRNLIQILPVENRYAFEFRDLSWFTEDIIELLTDTDTAFCIYDMEGNETPLHTTTDFVYIRLHGPAAKYQGSYSKELLEKWAERFGEWLEEGKEIYCYFNNDYEAYAPKNAATLLQMITVS
jgi:uncharacterized protein YecE (DUF72 family)